MLDIKFRAWDMDNNCWADLTANFSVETIGIRNLPYNFRTFIISGNNRYKIQKFTGLKDKNCMDIYDGDIAQVGDNILDIRWVGSGFWIYDPESIDIELNYKTAKTIEIIGNICENPEMIDEY